MAEKENDANVQAEPVPDTLDEETAAADVREQVVPEEQGPLQAELLACQEKAQEYLDGWQRARAEFANYKKRVERDQGLLRQNLTGEIIKRYLDVLDDLALALKNRPQEGEGAAWAAGVELIYRKMLAVLESYGVQVMQADGQFFDPTLHEAISSEPSDDHESGEILEVIKSGYLMGERVLRPALVRVAR